MKIDISFLPALAASFMLVVSARRVRSAYIFGESRRQDSISGSAPSPARGSAPGR
jgi:hypothetical protein